ncbi:hypothetical protein [Alteribacillus sp. YIM 98480]|uniref:hypothetical protein n=1 Tax=Alteribacillus sp. YIM 98480 TaxID=2606599 RepID=UPI00131C2AF6|nr:hypothetical protein [Alteribacillus sp. YIM 98480]
MNLWESFDKNEISIIIMIAIAYAVIFLLPKKFTADITLLFLLFGFTIGVLHDFTIGGGLIDFYRLNNSHSYEIFDFLYYLLFAPFSYLFIYFYEVFRIHKITFIWYIIAWALIGVGMQSLFIWMDIIHFQNGYELHFSFPVFLMTQTITALYYEIVSSRFKVFKE